jgi:hypothetical protein
MHIPQRSGGFIGTYKKRGNDKKHKKITAHQNVKIKGLMKISYF